METERLSDSAPTASITARKRRLTGPLLSAAAVIALASGVVIWVNSDQSGDNAPAAASSASDEIRTDTQNSPPKTLIAAGRIAVSAYWTGSWENVRENSLKLDGKTIPTTVKRYTRTWSLYSPGAGAYERTAWSWVDVAPGMQKAAVLEGQLPSKRLGILDMKTQNVVTWINLPQGAASLSWSPDGTKVLATAYTG